MPTNSSLVASTAVYTTAVVYVLCTVLYGQVQAETTLLTVTDAVLI